jgi:hypothetical protein
VKNNQQRINRQGVKFKGFIPAVYGRVTGNILKGPTGIAVKQTTFQFRNAYNEPDEFEASILKNSRTAAFRRARVWENGSATVTAICVPSVSKRPV